MGHSYLPSILAFYGLFLISGGMASIIFIGWKAKTAMLSGGISGSLSLILSYLVFNQISSAITGGILLSFGLFCVFSWRSTKTLFRIFELLKVTNPPDELQTKGIAFLIISLMAVVSLFVFAMQVILFFS